VIPRQELYDRACVADLIHVIEQAPLRVAVRRPLPLDRSSTGLLLLWSLLRWERTFLIQTLERLGIDLWALTRDVDETLKLRSKQAREAGVATDSADLDSFLRGWLGRAAAKARGLNHAFLGGEHLLLALLASADSALAAVFQRNGLTYESLRRAVVDALGGDHASVVLPPEDGASSHPERTTGPLAAVEDDRSLATREDASWIADIDRPAVGVPRRFGVFLMMLMVTLYAILFSMLRMLRATNLVFGLFALLFTGIGIGQAVLFGGRYPRLASIWIGAILVPIEVCASVLIQKPAFLVFTGPWAGTFTALALVVVFLLSVLPGAVFGYLFGTLTAGGFYLVDWYEKRQQAAKAPSAKS